MVPTDHRPYAAMGMGSGGQQMKHMTLRLGFETEVPPIGAAGFESTTVGKAVLKRLDNIFVGILNYHGAFHWQRCQAGAFIMTSIDQELNELRREIAERERYIKGQEVLIEVLERDGHDVVEQEISLNRERSMLASQIAQQFELVMKTIKKVE